MGGPPRAIAEPAAPRKQDRVTDWRK